MRTRREWEIISTCPDFQWLNPIPLSLLSSVSSPSSSSPLSFRSEEPSFLVSCLLDQRLEIFHSLSPSLSFLPSPPSLSSPLSSPHSLQHLEKEEGEREKREEEKEKRKKNEQRKEEGKEKEEESERKEKQELIRQIRLLEYGIDDEEREKERKEEKTRARLTRAMQRLSEELYSSDVHFVHELIQNGDDNSYFHSFVPSLAFVVKEKEVLVFNNELGFSEKNVRGF